MDERVACSFKKLLAKATALKLRANVELVDFSLIGDVAISARSKGDVAFGVVFIFEYDGG